MAKVSIELPSGGPAFYFGGDVVQATVIVECTAPFQTRSLYVDIYGRISTEVGSAYITYAPRAPHRLLRLGLSGSRFMLTCELFLG